MSITKSFSSSTDVENDTEVIPITTRGDDNSPLVVTEMTCKKFILVMNMMMKMIQLRMEVTGEIFSIPCFIILDKMDLMVQEEEEVVNQVYPL